MYNYYESELKRLKHSEYFKSVKFFDGTGESTKTLDLNLESIPEIIEFLRLEMKRLCEVKSQEYLKHFKESEENN